MERWRHGNLNNGGLAGGPAPGALACVQGHRISGLRPGSPTRTASVTVTVTGRARGTVTPWDRHYYSADPAIQVFILL